ncbi:MAG: hypothetical protein M3135_09185 [Actinomycetota bacterium]|nr:hypothetical protein [Actinomycetota bacterium]
MDPLRSNASWKAWPLLVVGVLIGSLALTPLVSAAGKALTKKKAVKLFEEEKDAAAQYALFEEEAEAASRYVRVASAGSETGFTGGSVSGGQDGTVVSTQISAPGAGFLVVSASSEMSASQEDGTGCAIRIDGAQLATSLRQVNVSDSDSEICATHGMQAVTAGMHTVDLRGIAVGGGGFGGTHGPGSINVLFVALGPTGGLGV